MMTPVSAGNTSNGENNKNNGTPTIPEIMASQTQPRAANSSMAMLPPCTYMDQNSQSVFGIWG
eukprot:1025996-Ditylum_brightwellii.AAC.1